jgi:hypothetical protein
MEADVGVMFAERFLDKHAGPIISDTAVAIVELVANCWDAYATEVEITWPDSSNEWRFEVRDNGRGMTRTMFERRWGKLDYDRTADEGASVEPPTELPSAGPRRAYGRNGRGRHGAFRFADPYEVRTWREGRELTYQVKRGLTAPFDIKLVDERNDIPGHGTALSGTADGRIATSADDAREIIGSRFLSDPNFRVLIDGQQVTFDDVPIHRLHEMEVSVEPFGTVQLIFVDSQTTDRSTRQHGVAWWVNTRLVGSASWGLFDQARLVDGRTREARRFQVIVKADFLEEAVLPDWTGFEAQNTAWIATREAVHEAIQQQLLTYTAEKRNETKAAVQQQFLAEVRRMSPVGRDRWSQFVDKVVDTCPSLSGNEVEQIAGILANLEISQSKFGLINRLHELNVGELDKLNQLLIDWNVQTAKLALDEVQSRIRLIAELDSKLRDPAMDEVADLQPLFDRSLWVFGPEFESMEFTSNKGMTTVIQMLFGSKQTGTLIRPDFVVIPDGSVGFYSRVGYDRTHEVSGVASLVVAEIKRVGVTIGDDQKNQAWKYVSELADRGIINDRTMVTCFVLGSKVNPTQASERTEWDKRAVIRPMSYETFIKRAEARMFGLRDKLKDAPFLKESGVDPDAFIEPKGQTSLFEVASQAR